MQRKPVGLWFFSILLVSVILNTPQFQADDNSRSSATGVGPPLLSVAPGEDLADVRGIMPEEQEEIIAQAIDNQWQHVLNLEQEQLEPREVQAENGLIAYVGNDDSLYLVNPDDGVRQSLVTDLQNVANPAWSPNEEQLAFIAGEAGNRCVYVLRLSDRRRTASDCVFHNIWEVRWSPDGRHIALWGQAEADGPDRAWMMPAEGRTATEVASGLLRSITPNWIDSDTMVLAGEETTDVWYIYRVDISQPDGQTPVTPAISPNCVGTFAAYPILSPDGTDIAYIGARSEGDKSSTDCYYAIYLVDPQGQEQPRKIADVADTTQAGHASINLMRWAPQDSQRLGLLASGSDDTLRLTTVRTYDGNVEAVEALQGGAWWGWDWSPDRTHMAAGYLSPDAAPEDWELDKVDPANDVFAPLAEGRAPVWSSVPPPQPVDLEARAVEVTQAIQRLNLNNPNDPSNNNIPLVKGKETVVRVYVSFVGQSPSDKIKTTARVWFEHPGGGIVEGQPLNGPVAPQQTPQRDETDHSLNFLLPIPDALDASEITIYAQVNADRSVPEQNFANNTAATTLTLVDSPSMELVGVPVGYSYDNRSADAPPVEDIARAAERVRRMYPLGVGDLRITTYGNGQRTFTIECALGSNVNDESYLKNCWAPFAGKLATDTLLSELYQDLNHPRIYGLLPDKSANAPGYWLGYGSRTLSPPTALGRNLNDGNGVRAGNLMAHELGHTIQPLIHSSNTSYAPIQQTGFDTVQNLLIPSSYHDIMSYKFSEMWISPANYEDILETLQEENVPSQSSPSEIEPRLLVIGVLTTNDVLDLHTFYQVDHTVTSSGAGGEYAVELQSADNDILVSHNFDVDFSLPFGDSDDQPAESPPAIIAEWVPFDEQAARVVVRRDAEILAERVISEHTPEVTLLMPNGGENWATDTIQTIEWQASDTDGDALTFVVRYRPQSTSPWIVLDSGLTGTSLTINTSQLAGGDDASIQVLASDGVRTAQDISDATFSVSRQAPQAFILFPEADARLEAHIPFELVSYAFDAEDGLLEDDDVCWSLPLGAELGCGTHVVTSLPAGRYTILLTATDSDGNSTTTSRIIQVGNLIYLPGILR